MFEQTIAQIKRLCKDDSVVVSSQVPPHYLSSFVKESVIYVYKQKELSTSLISNHVRIKSDSDYDDNDFTGQPLECSFESDETILVDSSKCKEFDDHCPLDLEHARKIISLANLKMNVFAPLLILTSGTDRNRTIILGSKKQSDGWYSRSWINLRDFSIDGAKVCDVDDMIKEHKKLCFLSTLQSISEVSCKYLMDSIGDSNSTFLQKSVNSIEFCLMWKTPSFNVPLDRTSVNITIKCNIGGDFDEISTMWHHLSLLYDYLEIIKKWKSDINTQGLYSRHYINFPNIFKLTGETQNTGSLQDRLLELLRQPNGINRSSLFNGVAESVRGTFGHAIVKINVEKAEEFTDRLWNLLVECSTYEELTFCFDKVFQAIKNGICKPHMKTTNSSRLANAIRCCRNDPDRFSFTFEPLELLVEIGIEKLKKEFVAIFLLGKVATVEQLNVPVLPKYFEIPITDWMENCSQWFIWLLRTHIILQLMLLTEKTITFKGCIAPLTALALKHYHGVQSPIFEVVDPRSITHQYFTSAMNSADIEDLLNRKTPFNSWQLKMHSETEHRTVESIFYRDMNDTFPSSVTIPDCLEGSVNNTYTMNAFPYHCYNYHCVSDFLGS